MTTWVTVTITCNTFTVKSARRGFSGFFSSQTPVILPLSAKQKAQPLAAPYSGSFEK
jgi:hypothetical protein